MVSILPYGCFFFVIQNVVDLTMSPIKKELDLLVGRWWPKGGLLYLFLLLFLDWERLSGWLESCCWWRTFQQPVRKPSSESSVVKHQTLTTVLRRTPITQMTFFNQGILLLGSNHFFYFSYLVAVVVIVHMYRLPVHLIHLISYFIYILKVTRVHC